MAGGETVNISVMAEKVSNEIFSKFGWLAPGPTNQNTPCEKTDEHHKKSSPTHPTDVAFYYDDPYERERFYLLTDLKSYAKGSITGAQIRGAIQDLAKSVDCANVSTVWREKFVNETKHFQVHGMLFIYNHDGEFDGEFSKFFKEGITDTLALPRDRRIYVFGPKRIQYLMSVINDIEVEQGRQNLPHWEKGKMPLLYPDRIRKHSVASEMTCATAELLLGPWLMIPYSVTPKGGQTKQGIYFYYDGAGAKYDEFTFIFDFAFKNQLVKDGQEISIRMPNAAPNAAKNFEIAQEVFNENFYSSHPLERLRQFKVIPVNRVIQQFSEEQIGMERR